MRNSTRFIVMTKGTIFTIVTLFAWFLVTYYLVWQLHLVRTELATVERDCVCEEGLVNVKELIELLQSMDGDRLVVLSSDPEGNSYAKLTGHSDRHTYVEEHEDIYYMELTQEERDAGYTDEDCSDEGVPCFVLYP